MTGAWDWTAKLFLVSAVMFVLGLMGGGLLSLGDLFCALMATGFCTSLLGAIVLVFVCWITLRYRVHVHLRRPPLSDEEFAALLGREEPVDLEVVRNVRELAAQKFLFLGGARFYPQDRLQEDLHLADLAPWATEDFWNDLEEAYLDDREEDPSVVDEDIVTFGDIVLMAGRLSRLKSRPV